MAQPTDQALHGFVGIEEVDWFVLWLLLLQGTAGFWETKPPYLADCWTTIAGPGMCELRTASVRGTKGVLFHSWFTVDWLLTIINASAKPSTINHYQPTSINQPVLDINQPLLAVSLPCNGDLWLVHQGFCYHLLKKGSAIHSLWMAKFLMPMACPIALVMNGVG